MLVGHRARFLGGVGNAVLRVGQVQAAQHSGEVFAVLGQADRGRRGAQDGHPGGFQPGGQVERGLPAQLQDDAQGFFALDHVEDVFEGHGLKIQAVGGVVIGRDGLRVAVDHDDLVTQFAQGKGRLAGAVIKFDALADAVGPAAQDHDLARVVVGLGFVFQLIAACTDRGCGRGIRPRRYPRAGKWAAPQLRLRRRRTSSAELRPHRRARWLSAKPARLARRRSSRSISGIGRRGSRQFLFQACNFQQVVQKPGVDAGRLVQSQRAGCQI